MDVFFILAIVALVWLSEQLFASSGGGSAAGPDSPETSGEVAGPVPAGAASGDAIWQTVFSAGGAVTSRLQQFAQAIYDFEDPNKDQVATRNNNPGNLKYAGQAGATGADEKGFAIFPDLATGFAALQRQLTKDEHRGLTISQLFSKWLGGSGAPVNNAQGNSSNYAAFVASRVGASVSDTLQTVFGG